MQPAARLTTVFALLMAVLAAASASAQTHDDAQFADTPALRLAAAQPTQQPAALNDALPNVLPGKHAAPHRAGVAFTVPVKLLGFNDYHGWISAGQVASGRQVGGAAVFAAYLKQAAAGHEDSTIIVNAGDSVGASPLSSALAHDEPTLMLFNQLANHYCSDRQVMNPRCNMVGTLGNHEFDHGRAELMRQIHGGNAADGPFLENPWRGLRFPMINANVVDSTTGNPILPPYVIKEIPYRDPQHHARKMLRIGFIGAVLRDTPTIVTPSGVAGLSFLDEAESINHYVPELKAKGVSAIIVTIHQGGAQAVYTGVTDAARPSVTGDILPIIAGLDSAIDVVVSGHTHAFTNAIVNNAEGHPILVAQAFSFSSAFDNIDLKIDPQAHKVVSKSAAIITTYAYNGKEVAGGSSNGGGKTLDDLSSPAITPDAAAAALVAQAEARSAPIANRVIGSIAADITRDIASVKPISPCPALAAPDTNEPAGCFAGGRVGEESLGDLIADAHRAAAHADFAFMNPGGIRTDMLVERVHAAGIPKGAITYSDVFNVQPFGGSILRMTLTGQQIYDLLNQQFPPNQTPGTYRFLQVSGLAYTWDASAPAGNKIIEIRQNGQPIDRSASYSVAANAFIAAGGDRFTVLTQGNNRSGVGQDLDVLVQYVESIKDANGVFTVPVDVGQRVVRLH